MVEAVLLDQAVSVALTLMGGAAGILVFSTFWNAWNSWRQTQEVEHQTQIQLALGESALLILNQLRGKKMVETFTCSYCGYTDTDGNAVYYHERGCKR